MGKDPDLVDLQDVLPQPPSNKRSLRTGWTTGSCAAAAAKASVIATVSGKVPDRISIPLPKGGRATFDVFTDMYNRCYIIKDAGDDPDCTDGAHVTAETYVVADSDEILIEGGLGVGTVTLSGLGLKVGGPAINPVPQKMITEAIREVYSGGVRVVVSVPGGEEMAKKTTNARLGIVGGISILGTTGVVKPFSTSSFRSAMVQQLDVARSQGEVEAILATGSKSEGCARCLFPKAKPVVFTEIGDYSGVAIKHTAKLGYESVQWVGMVGKVTKLAQGMMMTHFHRSNVDTNVLREAALATRSNTRVIEAATATNTARHFFEVCLENGDLEPLLYLAKQAQHNCAKATNNTVKIDITMVDLEGSQAIVSTNPDVPTLYRKRRSL